MSNGQNNVGNSVQQGMGIGAGIIILFMALAMLPICGCGGCLLAGFMAAPLTTTEEERQATREWHERLQEQLRQRKEQREAERVKGGK